MLVNPPTLPSNEEVQYDDEVFREIEDYFEDAEKGEPIQVGDLPQYVLSSRAWLGASLFGGAGPLTSRESPADAGFQYACKDWVFRLSAKKLRFISREYRLGHLPSWATGDERPHPSLPCYMAISEAILKTGVFLPFHSFIEQVLKFFDIVPF